jgi:hypothetical protein
LKNNKKEKQGMKYYIDIIGDGAGVGGRRRSAASDRPEHLNSPELDEKSTIRTGGGQLSLVALGKTLVSDDLDAVRAVCAGDSGQRRIGQALQQQLFGNVGAVAEWQARDGAGEVTVISPHAHILRLPWDWMRDGEGFMESRGWRFAVAVQPEGAWRDVEIRESYHALIAAPEPPRHRTGGDTHFQEIEEKLSEYEPQMLKGQRLHRSDDWKGFKASLKKQRPEIVYFYGAVRAGGAKCDLAFKSAPAKGAKARIEWVEGADFVAALKALKTPPKLVYLNCLEQSAGLGLPLAAELADFIPAVIVNRTLPEDREIQRLQGRNVFENLLIHCQPPHDAVEAIAAGGGMTGLGLDQDADLRWIRPTLFRSYDGWACPAPAKPRRGEARQYDPHWYVKIDRTNQFPGVALDVQKMLLEKRNQDAGYLWYGAPGQGIEFFHHRLRIELQELNPDTPFVEIRPVWPDGIKWIVEKSRSAEAVQNAFAAMLMAALGDADADLAGIPGLIRERARRGREGTILVYVRHAPIEDYKLVPPSVIAAYLEWFDAEFLTELDESQCVLLGISYEVNRPTPVRMKADLNKRIHTDHLEDLGFRILDELERLAIKDLKDFMRQYEISLPRNQNLDDVLEKVYKATGGHYDSTVEELKSIIRGARTGGRRGRRRGGK